MIKKNKLKEASKNLWKQHKGLTLTLIIFTIIHLFLWTHYYASYYGWVKKMDIFNPSFFLAGFIYWIVYSCIFYISYTYGKTFFLVVVSLFLFSIVFTIPFSLAKVDLGVKFALILKNDFEWNYIRNYLSWIVISFGLGIPIWLVILRYLSKSYRLGLKVKKKFQTVAWVCCATLLGWHTIIGRAIDTESLPVLHYDNEVGRMLRLFTALGTQNFEVFEYKDLPGQFSLYENSKNKTTGIHGVFAILDTLEYEFLSIHKNKGVPLNKDLKSFIDNGVLVDMGVVYSCGSHTTASLPNMLSMNGCRIGPKFHSEPIMHLMQRIGVDNHYIGAQGLSQYFATIFSLSAREENRHYIEYSQTATALKIGAEDIKAYPNTPSSFTMIYYDAVHPGIRCEFLTGGGLPDSFCHEGRNFSGDIYQEGMNKAVEVIEKDIVKFIQISEDSPKPIFLILTADHGLSPHFLHGDMADSDVSLDKIQEATQRHTNVLIYGNKAYRKIKSQEWKFLIRNSKEFSGRLDHEILFPTLINAMGIEWNEGKDVISKNSIFSKDLIPKRRSTTQMNSYLS